MSHVLLGDDADQKSYALLCLIGSFPARSLACRCGRRH